MDPIETKTYKGYTIEVHQDQDAGNPRKEWDNAGIMACWHRRYDLGDKDGARGMDVAAFQQWAKEETARGGIFIPLYLYDHGGITIRAGSGFSCPWDSGQVGYVYALRETILKEWGTGKGNRITKKARELARKCLMAETETYDHYLTGAVYGYVVKDADGEDVGSCWGFYGYDDKDGYMMNEARSEADRHEREQEEKLAEEHVVDMVDAGNRAYKSQMVVL